MTRTVWTRAREAAAVAGGLLLVLMLVAGVVHVVAQALLWVAR